MWIVLFFLSTVLLLYLCYKKHFSYWSKYTSVASVPGRIFSGNFRDFITFKTNFGYHLKTIYDDPKYANEPVVGVYGLITPGLLIREPELIKTVLIKDFECFCDRFGEADPHHDPLGALTIVFARYNLWKEIRPQLTPIFSSGKLKYMYPLIQKVGENMDYYLKKQQRVFATEMKDLCARYTTDVIATTVFGFESNSLDNPKQQLNVETRKLSDFNWSRAFDLLMIFFIPKWVWLFKSRVFYKETEIFLRTSVKYAIEERERSGEKRNDLIDIFVKLKQEASKNGEDVGKIMECLTAQSGIFMFAGFETSSTTMANVLLELAKQPDLLRRLREEICEAVILENGEISYESMNNLQYLDMVTHETLRMYPVLPLLERKYVKPAQCTELYSLQPYCDFTLPDGMPMYISPYALHYDPEYWSNPTKFDPERFSAANKHSINPMVYLPFGNGPHNCVGGRLGLLQVKTGLIALLKNHYVRVCDKTIVQPEFEAKAVVLQIKGGVYLEIVRDEMCDNGINKI